VGGEDEARRSRREEGAGEDILVGGLQMEMGCEAVVKW